MSRFWQNSGNALFKNGQKRRKKGQKSKNGHNGQNLLASLRSISRLWNRWSTPRWLKLTDFIAPPNRSRWDEFNSVIKNKKLYRFQDNTKTCSGKEIRSISGKTPAKGPGTSLLVGVFYAGNKTLDRMSYLFVYWLWCSFHFSETENFKKFQKLKISKRRKPDKTEMPYGNKSYEFGFIGPIISKSTSAASENTVGNVRCAQAILI